jgi:Domain of unknown function (DUF4260)
VIERDSTRSAAAVISGPRRQGIAMMKMSGMTILLRLEGLALALLAVWLYHAFHQPWWVFAVLFLAPDLSMLGYLGGPKIGAAIYNAVHSWITVAALFFLVWYGFGESGFALSLPFILAAHIGIDRALGYGLKHASGFKDTHLGTIGKAAWESK